MVFLRWMQVASNQPIWKSLGRPMFSSGRPVADIMMMMMMMMTWSYYVQNFLKAFIWTMLVRIQGCISLYITANP